MVYELTALLAAYGTTAFLLGEYTEEDILALSGVRGGRWNRRVVAAAPRQPRRALLPRLQAARQPLPRGHARVPHHRRGARHLSAPRQPAVPEDTSRRRSASRPGSPASMRCSVAASGAARQRCSRAVRRRQDDDRPAVRARRAASGRAESVHELPGESVAAHPYDSRPGRGPGEARAQGLDLVYASPVELADRQHHRRHVSPDPTTGVRGWSSCAWAIWRARRPTRSVLHDYLYALVQHFAVSGITSVLELRDRGNAISPRAAEPDELSVGQRAAADGRRRRAHTPRECAC